MRAVLVAALILLGISWAPGSATAGPPYTCISSQAQGVSCGLPDDQSDFVGILNNEGQNPNTATEIDIDQWNDGGGSSNYCNNGTYKLKANSAEDWKLQTNIPTPNPGQDGVCAYPNVWEHDAEGTVDSYSKITAAFTETFPHTADVQAHGMEDDWFDNWSTEVMVQYDFSNEAPCGGTFPQEATNLSFGGEYNVPVQSWHICTSSNGATIDFKLGASDATLQSEPSGKVDLLPMLRWAETNINPVTGLDYLPAASGQTSAEWTAFSMGFEVLSTNGTQATFAMTRALANFQPVS